MLLHEQCALKVRDGFVGGHRDAENAEAVRKFARYPDDVFKLLAIGRLQVIASRAQQKRRRGAGPEGVLARIFRHIFGDHVEALLQIVFAERHKQRLFTIVIDGIRLYQQLHELRAVDNIHADFGQNLAGIAVDAFIDPEFIGERVHIGYALTGNIRLRAAGVQFHNLGIVPLGTLKLILLLGGNRIIKHSDDLFSTLSHSFGPPPEDICKATRSVQAAANTRSTPSKQLGTAELFQVPGLQLVGFVVDTGIEIHIILTGQSRIHVNG